MIFNSEDHFKYIIVLSILLQKNCTINNCTNIENLTSFLKLICKITKNSKFKIKKDTVEFFPGKLVSGTFNFKCKNEIFEYIEPLLVLLPFSDSTTKINFIGITDKINCIDILKIAYFRILDLFEIKNLDLVVKKRGFYPEGEGEVFFSCGVIKEIKSIDYTISDQLEKIKGLLISARLNSSYVHNLSEKVKLLLSDFKVQTTFNVYNRNDSGPSPGYQCTLYAETETGIFFSTEDGGTNLPELTAKNCANNFLMSLNRGGCFDFKMTNLVLFFLALSSNDISQIKIAKLNESNRKLLEILKRFTNFQYKIVKEKNEYIFVCSGIGYINLNIKLN